MDRLTPAQRVIRARMGNAALEAKYGVKGFTQKARAASFERFIDQVDPERQLSEPERIKRAKAKEREHMLRMNLRSQQARSRGKER